MASEAIPICQDTWLLTQLEQAPPLGGIFLNSAVIRAAQPVLVDTGTAGNRSDWLQQVATVVDLVDVRWIFISHDDPDHVGNLALLLEECPRATVLTSWFAVGRMTLEQGIALPPDRVRFVNDDDVVDVGDRMLRAVLPPVYDNPTTRGLFDPKTGFFWGGDCFAAPVGDFVVEAADMRAGDWQQGFLDMHRMLSPWHAVADSRRFGSSVDRVQSLNPVVVAGAHGPVVRGPQLRDAYRLLRTLPHIAALAPFTQNDLESWLAATAAHTG